MIGEIQRDANLCVNVLFEENNNRLTSISGNIASYNLEIKKSCNWNEFIAPTIEEIIDTEGIIENNEDKLPPIDLKIRKRKSKDEKKDGIVDEKGKNNKKGKN